MQTITTNCSRFGHREFELRCADVVPVQDLEWAAAVLEGLVLAGRQIYPGETIQIGWMANHVAEHDRGLLLLQEPDMQSMPIAWTNGITQTLQHLRAQKDIAESLGLLSSMDIPYICQSLIVGNDVGRATEELVCERCPPSAAASSGWFVGYMRSRLDYNNPDNLRCVSLYEMATWCPQAIMFMALPAGTRVECSTTEIVVEFNGEKVAPRVGSFLAQFLDRRR